MKVFIFSLCNMLEMGSYIAGFVDGEGCFTVSFTMRKSIKTGIEVRPSFSISQKKFSLGVLKDIQSYFSCGGIRYSKTDGTYKYEVRSIHDLWKTIIPHFRKYQLITDKRNDFNSFDIICGSIISNNHLNHIGLIEIIELAYSMNRAGKRKYPKKDLLKTINKMKV